MVKALKLTINTHTHTMRLHIQTLTQPINTPRNNLYLFKDHTDTHSLTVSLPVDVPVRLNGSAGRSMGKVKGAVASQ